MDEFGEGIGNPFDTPIPGQSLTDEPGNYPWEHPPQYVTTDGAADHYIIFLFKNHQLYSI